MDLSNEGLNIGSGMEHLMSQLETLQAMLSEEGEEVVKKLDFLSEMNPKYASIDADR